MAETKQYEVGDFRFGFTPEGSPYKGLLCTQYPEIEPYASRVDLSSSRSRNVYAKEAQELYGISADDLKPALISLCAKRAEEVEAAKTDERDKQEERQNPEVPEEEIERRIGEPGVLERFVQDAATFSGVVREQEILKLLTLVCLSAQLDLLPNGKPVGSNNVLTAEAGRGKNFACDAVARLLPEEFYFEFVSSSAKSLYYQADDNPSFLKHRWIYPNEAEGTDQLVEMFRPLLSGGRAKHITVNKDANGRNSGQQFTIEGPMTLTIPTVRNKLDGQLQSRMLVAELPDYEGRVGDHSEAVSELLSSDYAATDYTEQIRAWKAALMTLTGIRRVITPKHNKEFRFDSDSVSYGARLWTNVLGLMCTHAWLEQRNRKGVALKNGEKAIVATPEDYEAAYEVFKATCERSVINLSDTHRKILDAVYALREKEQIKLDWFGFSQRLIANTARVSQSTVSDNKSFLVKSVKFMTETQDGKLNLVDGADPSWWEKGGTLDGFPKPEQVRIWWTGDSPTGPDSPNGSVHDSDNQDDREATVDDREVSDHENGLDKANSAIESGVIGDIDDFDIEMFVDGASTTFESNDHVWLPDYEMVQTCKDLLDARPQLIPDDVHDDEELRRTAMRLLWASNWDDGDELEDLHSIFEALKVIFKDREQLSVPEVVTEG